MSFGKARRVTYPLEDHAISRLFGRSGDSNSSSGGSEHDISEDDSPCLCDLIHGFFLEDDGSLSTESGSSEPDIDREDSDRMDAIEKLLRRRCGSEVDSYRNLLVSHVERAMEVCSLSEQSKSVLRRKVVLLLQDIGHNAAICKTKWDSRGGASAGKHEFIYVVSGGGQRYIIELDLASEFEIARPTRQYSTLMMQSSLPRVFVGKCEELKTVVKAMSEAAKISLRSRGLSVPPWRKSFYMKNKWFGSYRRTMTPTVAVCPVNAAVKYRSVGFDGSIDGRVVVRTR